MKRKMTTVPRQEGNEKNQVHFCNYSDDELILNELYLKFLSLQSQKMKMCRIRQKLLTINEKNEDISNSLIKIKTDCESHKSFLNNTLCTLKLSTQKQKILLRNKLEDFSKKRKAYEEYYKASPIKCELEELLKKNKSLEDEWKNKMDLFELTKKQYYELMNTVIETFKKKVCEFCNAVLWLEENSLKS